MQDTIGEVIATFPKPRGEGAWAWCRFYLLRCWHWQSDYLCSEPWCPYPPVMVFDRPASAYCDRHRDLRMTPAELEYRAKRRAESSAEFQRRKAAGEIPRRTFCQWMGINRPLR
jgi:hypothetical protein